MFVAVLFSRIVNGCITTMTVQILLYLEVSKRSTWAGHYGPYSYFSSCLGCLLVLVFLVYYTYSLYLISTAFFRTLAAYKNILPLGIKITNLAITIGQIMQFSFLQVSVFSNPWCDDKI